MQPILKILISALPIYGISELSKRSTFLGAVLASLLLISLLAMICLYWDTRDVNRVASFSTSVLWLVLPSIILFALLPVLLLRWRLSFPVALSVACGATVTAYFLLLLLLGWFGIKV